MDWLSETGEHFGLHTSTVHVAIMLMDRIHNSILVSRRQVQLVAMACLIIAAKYEEAEQHVPTAADLNQYANFPYSREDIYNSEAYLLTILDWKITEVVPLHYVGFFMAKGVLCEDDTVDNRPLVEKVPRYLMKYHVFFSELCMQGPHRRAPWAARRSGPHRHRPHRVRLPGLPRQRGRLRHRGRFPPGTQDPARLARGAHRRHGLRLGRLQTVLRRVVGILRSVLPRGRRQRQAAVSRRGRARGCGSQRLSAAWGKWGREELGDATGAQVH